MKLNKTIGLIVMFFISVLLVGSVSASNWYVDNAAPAGGNGQSWNTAWNSFANINWASVQPGDTIYISGGAVSKTYSDELRITSSGTIGHPITITKGIGAGHNGEVKFVTNGIYVRPAKYLIISKLSFDEGAQIYISGSSGSIYSASGASSNILIEDNYIHILNHGGVFVQASDHITVRGNRMTTPGFTTVQTDGIYSQKNLFNDYVGNHIIISNDEPNGHDDGIQSFMDTNMTYRYNFIWQNNTKESNAQGIYITTSNGTLYAYGNVIYGPKTKNSLLTNANYYGSNAVMYAYSNTLFGGGWGVLYFKDSPNSVAKNNIIISDKNSAVLPRIEGTMPSPQNWDYNLYYAPNSTYFFNNTIRTFAQWQAAGFDVHGKYVDPKFVDVLMQNFKLSSSSPAIDAGLSLGAPYALDKDGVSRPQGTAWDIGAYEYSSGTSQCASADSNCDSCISLSEISSYVSLWLSGSGVTLSQVSSAVSIWIGGCPSLVSPPAENTFVIGHNNMDITKIPASCINKVKTDLHIGFSHTSHGSQLPSGMNALMAYDTLYSYSQTGSLGLHFEDYPGRNVEYNGFGTGYCYDLGNCDNGGEGILLPTRTYLNSARGQNINVIMWSWSSILDHDINFYLDNMQTLIVEYENGSAQHPTPVKFVFITGYVDSQGPGEGSNFADYQNRLIRNFINNQSSNAFCKKHQCILFDFGDMEEYDPDNNNYLNRYIGDNLNYNGGNWGTEYLARHPNTINTDLTAFVTTCAHSDTPYGSNLNCALKGQAAWWLFARMVGWDGTQTDTCVD